MLGVSFKAALVAAGLSAGAVYGSGELPNCGGDPDGTFVSANNEGKAYCNGDDLFACKFDTRDGTTYEVCC